MPNNVIVNEKVKNNKQYIEQISRCKYSKTGEGELSLLLVMSSNLVIINGIVDKRTIVLAREIGRVYREAVLSRDKTTALLGL